VRNDYIPLVGSRRLTVHLLEKINPRPGQIIVDDQGSQRSTGCSPTPFIVIDRRLHVGSLGGWALNSPDFGLFN
jgi:hypothetical protein